VQQTSRSLNWILVRVARAFRDTLSATNACAKRPAHVRPPHTLPLLQLIVVRGQSSCTMAGEEGANQPCRLRGQPDGGAYYTATVFIWLYAARGCIGARLSGSAASARRMGACRALRRGVAAPAGINGMKGGAGDDVEMPETPPTPVKPAPAPPPTRWQAPRACPALQGSEPAACPGARTPVQLHPYACCRKSACSCPPSRGAASGAGDQRQVPAAGVQGAGLPEEEPGVLHAGRRGGRHRARRRALRPAPEQAGYRDHRCGARLHRGPVSPRPAQLALAPFTPQRGGPRSFSCSAVYCLNLVAPPQVQRPKRVRDEMSLHFY